MSLMLIHISYKKTTLYCGFLKNRLVLIFYFLILSASLLFLFIFTSKIFIYTK
nr:MAG TPA: hypothetical protein [Caudoviricetes sp.]